MARERHPALARARTLLRWLAVAGLALAFNSVAFGAEPVTAPAPTEPPQDLRDVNAWVQWKAAGHLSILPFEARIFYRRGLDEHVSGQDAAAFRDVRGAAELDPTFLEPQLTLASWSLVRDPSAALLHYAVALDLLRRSFDLQLELAANGLTLALEAVLAGLAFAGLIVVVLRRAELVHALQERLALFASRESARWWAPLLLALPLFAGFGIVLPTLALLGYLWTNLRFRERTLFVLLAAAVTGLPFATAALDRCALALRGDAPPFYDTLALPTAPWSPSLQSLVAREAAGAPHDPFAQFALGWTARRGGDLDTAERAYRATLAAWPDNDVVMTDLGNVLAVRGQVDAALDLYARAAAANARNAAAHFNASQLHTQRFEYQAATDELQKASSIDFELVRTFQSQAGAGGVLPLADAWLEPPSFWHALRDAPARRGPAVLPPALRGHIETAGWPFSALALAVALLGLIAGLWQHHAVPLRTCNNCGTVICRRCARRRREHALCRACDTLESRAETQEFSRVLLLQHRSRRRRAYRLAHTALAALIPGFGMLSHRRVFTAVFLLGSTWMILRLWSGYVPPFSVQPHFGTPGQDVPIVVLAVLLGVAYAWSLAGYFRLVAQERAREAQLAATQRGRITQATRRSSALAA